MSARPFLRWAGSKRQLLPELLTRVPKSYNNYHEPFLGGGSVFFGLPERPDVAYLSDLNAELIWTYAIVAYQTEDLRVLLDEMAKHQSKEDYLQVRAADVTEVMVAARMIYLNKCGWNGLFRVNKSGKFNVPWGKRTNVKLYDHANLDACSLALQKAKIQHRSFETVMDHTKPGDLVYLDSPYVPVSKTSNFTAYTKDGFGPDDQIRVRDVARTLKDRGVHVIVSNAGTDEVRELYAGFNVEEVSARRAINSKGSKRGPVKEFIIT